MTKITRARALADIGVPNSVYNPEYLRQQSRWIRDDLDPQVARNGPDALHSDEILKLDEFLRRLLTSNINLDDIAYSRLHNTLGDVVGKATRWSERLIERADAVLEVWEIRHGPLHGLVTPLYGAGGRLHGVCRPEDDQKEQLIIKWLKTPGVKLSPLLARRICDLGFKPGDWWINSLLAFRAGIIDSADGSGGIVADAEGAYAIMMTADEELNCPSPDAFTYRSRNSDQGRYRLTAATRESRERPIRVLRSHSLRTMWGPRAGLRYDGLHVVTGWSIGMDPKTKQIVYDIHFRRLDGQVSMDTVLRRPYADEIEDYKEYKRLRQKVRDARLVQAVIHRPSTPIVKISLDSLPGDRVSPRGNLQDLRDSRNFGS